MRLASTLFILFYSLNSFCQFAIVSDKDSVLNVRKDGLQSSKVIDRLEIGHLIYCFENKANWTYIYYTKNGKELNGYVYKDRYKLVESFPAFKLSKKTAASITLKKDSIEVTITQRKFDKTKHKFTYYKESADQIRLIDNKQYWGTDGGTPITQFEKIIIKAGNKLMNLPPASFEGLYEPTIYTAEVNYDDESEAYYIQTMNSDGAGAYYVIWKVEKGVYKERLVAYGF